MTSGTTGWLPVAMTTWSAVRLSPVETSRARGPVKRAWPRNDGRVLAMGPVVLAAARDGVDPAEDAVADVLPAHPVQGGVDAEAGAGGDGVGDVGGVDEHLGGDAADVQAGAAEGAALDDRDLLVLEVRRDEGVAGAGPDDREVEVRHAVQPRASLPLAPARPHAQTWWFCTRHPANLVVLHGPTTAAAAASPAACDTPPRAPFPPAPSPSPLTRAARRLRPGPRHGCVRRRHRDAPRLGSRR